MDCLIYPVISSFLTNGNEIPLGKAHEYSSTMQKLAAVTKSFINSLGRHDSPVPQKEVMQLLTDLLVMADEVKDSLAVKLFKDILSTFKNQQSETTDMVGVDLLVSMLKFVDHHFDHLLEHSKIQGNLELCAVHLEERVVATDSIDTAEAASVNEVSLQNIVADRLQTVCSSNNYLTHYLANHSDIASVVVVVLWKGEPPGLPLCHNEMPVLYVSPQYPRKGVTDCDWFSKPKPKVLPKEFTASELQEARRVDEVIAQHQEKLFAKHSNLVAIRSSGVIDGEIGIQFIVLCKNFIPVEDEGPLPRYIGGIRTHVRSGWAKMCGPPEQRFHRPLLPGAGFAVETDSKLLLEVAEEDYAAPVLGTIGGYYVAANGNKYGVTCAHCIRKGGTTVELHPPGSTVVQPSLMGLILDAANAHPGLIGTYDWLKLSHGNHYAMSTVVKKLQKADPNFNAQLPEGARCGVVHCGVLGSLADDGPVVDVALVKLDEAVAFQPHCTVSWLDVTSPPMILSNSTTTTNILKAVDFPSHEFPIYGRGAWSSVTMKALVNPIQSTIYFRDLKQAGLGKLVFKCIHAKTAKHWHAGDSGTWCWTADGSLVGMGMAYAHIGNNHYCCMLPMSDVVAGIEQMI